MRLAGLLFLALLLASAMPWGAARAQEDDDDDRKWTVEELKIEGNEEFSDGELKDFMVMRPVGWFRSITFREELFREDLNNLLEFYRANGYFNVQVVDTLVVRDTSDYEVRITVTVEEGPQTVVEGIGLFGNATYADSTLLDLIELEPGSAYRRRLLQEGMMAIASFYADSGYLEASVVPKTKINEEVHRVLIDLVITEGQQMAISDILIHGLIKTDTSVVERELTFSEGEVVSFSQLRKSQRLIYLTGLFSSVYIEPVRQPNDSVGQRTIVVEVDEKKNSLFSVSLGYGSVEKVMGETEFSVRNLAGTARQIGLLAEANFIRRGIEASFTEPRTFDTRFQTDANAYYRYQDEPSFDVSRLGARLTVGRRFGERGNASLAFRYENQRLRHVETVDLPEDTDPQIRSVTLAVAADSRDNLFNPSRGLYSELSYELAGAFFAGTNTFNRIIGRTRWYRPVRLGTVLATGVEGGWMDVFGEGGRIPVNELFFTGGPNSIRGFDYQEVGPADSTGLPIGGQFLLVGNVELRQHVWKWFGLVGFVDVGNVWSKVREYRFGEIRYAAGSGVRASTPIGIARLDVGFNLDPVGGEEVTQVHLSMGHAF